MMSKLFKLSRRLWIKAQLTASPWLQRIVINPLHQAKRLARLLFKPYLNIYQWQGQSQEKPLTVIFGSNNSSTKSFFKSILFTEEPIENVTGRIFLGRLSKLTRLQGDLIIIEADKISIRNHAYQHSFVMPLRVEFIMDVRGDWREVQLRTHNSIRRHEFRLIRKYGYEYEISHNDQDFNRFYSEMYLPTMSGRHNQLADPVSRAEAYLYFQHGLLLMVKRDDVWVSGGVALPHQNMVNFRLLGIKNADEQLLHQGAQAAVYYAIVHWANQEGFEAVNFEGCRPYMAGLFQYKRKWGTSVSIPTYQYEQIWIKVQHFTPAVQQFLKDNPCVVVDKKENLYGLIMVDNLDNISPEIKKTWHKQYMMPGLSHLLAWSTAGTVETSLNTTEPPTNLTII